MKEIFPGIYQITLTQKGFAPGSVNAYAVRDARGGTLIDTGWGSPESAKLMETRLVEAHIGIHDINRVILTHFHMDHLGLMGKFKEWNQATICIHRNEIELIKIRYGAGDTYWPMTDLFLKSHGVPDSEFVPPEYPLNNPVSLTTPDILFNGNEEISIGEYTFKIINTPGHTPGHISLYEARNKFLISGDTLLPTIITNAATHIQYVPDPINQYLNSLQTLRNLDINLVLPGHDYVFSNYRARIDEIVAHYQQKRETTREAVKDSDQPFTAYDVARRLPYAFRNRTLTWDQLRKLDKRFAALQAIALMEELVNSKIVTRSHQNDKFYYSKIDMKMV